MTETAPPDSPPVPSGASPDDSPGAPGAPYQVLARKYRPATFADLIGQDAMVRTLTNAIRADRLAHAFILTGVRGVGKTSTARIIARALNCVGAGGTGGPTPDPCGACEHCLAIAEDRHVDVLEMDAASHTGVDNMREVIDGVRYRPTTARFKVYIIDEVHMLSKQAFNALLKTLEEPPDHVKFVFATTEIRKVPVTVLSRCQRFDLRRVDVETLSRHYADITAKEGAGISPAGLRLIARAADGSVRDGLSLLDQAMSDAAHGDSGKNEEIGEAEVRDMLGIADRSQSFQLLETVISGDVAPALELFDQLYREGADPLTILEDLLEITHWLTRIKVVPEAADAPDVPEIERVRGKDLESRLPMAALARAWQMLLKGIGEVRHAPSPVQAAEMVLVRLAYVSELPTPEEAIRALENGGRDKATDDASAAEAPVSSAAAAPPAPPAGAAPPAEAPGPSPAAPEEPGAQLTGTGGAPLPGPVAETAPPAEAAPLAGAALDPIPDPGPEALPGPEAKAQPDPATFQDVAGLALEEGQKRLHGFLTGDVHLVRFEPGRIEFKLRAGAPGDRVQELREFLNGATARTWTLTVSSDPGEPTLQQQLENAEEDVKAKAASHPLVKAVRETFPGATVEEVRPRPQLSGETETESESPGGEPDNG